MSGQIVYREPINSAKEEVLAEQAGNGWRTVAMRLPKPDARVLTLINKDNEWQKAAEKVLD